MNSFSDENRFESLFDKIELVPGERFYRKMKRAAWTPAGVARRRAWSTAGLTLLFAAAILAFTPMGRAWAQTVLRFFNRAPSDTLPVPTATQLSWAEVTPGKPLPTATPQAPFSQCGDFPKCSVEEIRGLVHFPVRELAAIPDGMHFIGATGGPDWIGLLYDNGSLTYGISLEERPWTDGSGMPSQEVGSSAVVETVRVGDATGEYVKGGFNTQLVNQPTFNQVHFQRVWDDKVGVETLRWISNGVFCSMSAYDDDLDHALLEKDAFIALAAGLTTEPVSARQTYTPPTPTAVAPITFEGLTYDLTMTQVKNKAGFTLIEPSRLPVALSLAGAAYEPDLKIARIFYVQLPLLDPSVTFGLRLSEEPAGNGIDCSLCGLVRGDYGQALTQKDKLVISPEAVVEDVKIGGTAGQYFVGQWMGPTWVPYASIETLRWQANGLAFELKYFGFMDASGSVPITKADLVTIAESLK